MKSDSKNHQFQAFQKLQRIIKFHERTSKHLDGFRGDVLSKKIENWSYI